MAISLIKKFIKQHWEIFVILALGLLSITWFRGDYLISGGDFGMPFDRHKYFKLMFSVWDDTVSLGVPDYRQVASLIPYALWGEITHLLGLSLNFFEKTLFYFWFAGSGLSMYYLCSVLGMRRLGKLAAAVFYMMNPFSLIVIWRISHALIQMPYAFAPLYLGLYINGLTKKKGFKYIVRMCFIWLFTTTSAYAWPAAVVIHWLPLAVFFCFYLISHPKSEDRVDALRFSALLLIFWTLLNLYWIAPFIYSLPESYDFAHPSALISDIDTFRLTSVSLPNALRMFGFWSQHSGFKGDPYYSYQEYYLSPFVILVSFLIPLLVFLPLLKRKRTGGRFVLFFAFLALGGLFFIKGDHSPFGGFIIPLYEKLPYVTLMVRFVFLFFGIPTYLAFAVLLGYGILDSYSFASGRVGILAIFPIGAIFVLLFFVLVFPFWSGEVVRSDDQVWIGERVKIPDYYWQFKDWIEDKEGDFRILPFPMSKTYNVANNWEAGYWGSDPMRWFSDKPVLYLNTGPSFKVAELIARGIITTPLRNARKILGLMGVRYLVLRNDTNWEFIRNHSWWFNHNLENLKDFFATQEGISLEKKFGNLDVYKLDESNLSPFILAPEKAVFVSGDTEALSTLVSFEDFEEEKTGAFFSSAGNEVGNSLAQAGEVFVQGKFSSESSRNLTIYSLDVPLDGNYEIFLRKGRFEKYFYPTSTLSIRLDDGAFEEKKLVWGEGLFSLGKIGLKKGEHVLQISPPRSINLLGNSSFEEGMWDEAIDANPSEEGSPDISASLVEDASEGRFGLKLITESHPVAVSRPFGFFERHSTYRISLDFKHLMGRPPRFAIWENDGDLDAPVWVGDPSPFGTTSVQTRYCLSDWLDDSNNWSNYEEIFEVGEYAETAGLALFSDPQEDGRTVNLYDNVRVEKVFDNPMILKSEVGNQKSEVERPEIEFTRLNPTKYRVRVQGAKEPYFLVFSEAFHPGWKVYINKVKSEKLKVKSYGELNGDVFLDRSTFETWGVGAVPEEKHVMANGFANSWYIEEPGDYEIILEFWPQRIFILSSIVSSLVLAGGLFYLVRNGR